MAKNSDDKLTVEGLKRLTGFNERTIKKRISILHFTQDGRKKLYDPKDALPLIYEVAKLQEALSSEDEILVPAQEKAKLDRAKRIKVESEIAEKLGLLVDPEDFKEEYSRLLSSIKKRFLALPARISNRLKSQKTVKKAEALMLGEIKKILRDLSDGG